MNHVASQSFPPAAPAAGSTPSPARVVICDDEPHITLAVSLKLRKAGYEVEAHPDGLSAWQSIAARPPALIVTDCQMPRMSGLDLLRSMRAEPRTAAVPAIMLTGKGFELSSVEMQSEMGPVRLFPKPFSPRELLDAVSAMMTSPAA
ncbi:response regulator [Alienimonas sp. DA493]|uniref:response regulator n=1 Tax=Alienimonas sp. DA493 TaxID=3373605 RepID=UPI0037541689